MQASNQLKHFTCQIHPSEVIARVCLDPEADSSLKCIECILNGTEKLSKESMIGFNEFIDSAARQYQTFRRASAFESAPSEELTKFLEHDEANIQKLCQHIEQEKERIHTAFNTVLQDFTELCFRKKNEMYNQLDKQLATLKFNYSYYKSKLDRYYNKEKGDELNPDKETLIGRINECQDTNQAEVLIKNIKDDLLEASSHESIEQKISQVKESFKDFAQTLQEQAQSLPKTKFCDQSTMNLSLRVFKDAADSLMNDVAEIDNQISELSFTNFLSIDSKLIRKPEELNLLKKWLAPSHQDFKLRLLYRGTRDGMNYEAFHKKCDNHNTTLTIAKSNLGKVFGGYSDQPWNNNSDYSVSQNCWLFSIDEKLKFPIMTSESSYAIYSYVGYGPTWGSGHDLYIRLPEKNGGYPEGGEQSYSEVGNAYELVNSDSNGNQPNSQTVLGGSYQFDIEELEIYAVEKRGKTESKLDDSELDSELINPKKDLNLIKSWLGRGKKHKLELIYRGSRDGFNYCDFHQNCGHKGPTLVVCKSKNFDKIFGGYTSKSWSQDGIYKEDRDAFLFSLTDSTKHPATEKDYAIYCVDGYGPVFGAGHDLSICSDSDNLEGSTCVLGVSYKATDGSDKTKNYLAGDITFLLDEIEVFTVETNDSLFDS